jgi:hypothetical protein
MGFEVILIKADGPVRLPEGNATGILTENPEIQSAFITGQCLQCGEIHIMEGYPHHVESNERSMGEEKLHTSEHYAACNCGEELFIEVEYMEYPTGTLQPYEIRPRSDVEYVDVNGLSYLANKSASSVQTEQEDLQGRLGELRELADSGLLEPEGANFSNLGEVFQSLIEKREQTVIVLGSYEEPHKEELENLVQILEGKGYDANLVEDLPELEEKSLKQKVALAMLMSKFNIMIDREPSGHLVEYEIARRQGSVMARLVPKRGGSTMMIEGEEETDSENCSKFEFSKDPEGVLDSAIEWAEERVEERREAFNEKYPWRDTTKVTTEEI